MVIELFTGILEPSQCDLLKITGKTSEYNLTSNKAVEESTLVKTAQVRLQRQRYYLRDRYFVVSGFLSKTPFLVRGLIRISIDLYAFLPQFDS